MKDLTNPRWMYLKGILFVLMGLTSAGLLILENPSLRNAGLLALTIWCFCRSYYFAFYVIEKYVEREFKFSGLGALLFHLGEERSAENEL